MGAVAEWSQALLEESENKWKSKRVVLHGRPPHLMTHQRSFHPWINVLLRPKVPYLVFAFDTLQYHLLMILHSENLGGQFQQNAL